MKKRTGNLLKNICYAACYWVVFIIIPFIFMIYLNEISHGHRNFLSQTLVYTFFFSPLLFTIPLFLAKPKSKLDFILIGLIIPYVIMCVFFYFSFRNIGPITLM